MSCVSHQRSFEPGAHINLSSLVDSYRSTGLILAAPRAFVGACWFRGPVGQKKVCSGCGVPLPFLCCGAQGEPRPGDRGEQIRRCEDHRRCPHVSHRSSSYLPGEILCYLSKQGSSLLGSCPSSRVVFMCVRSYTLNCIKSFYQFIQIFERREVAAVRLLLADKM